MPVEFLSDEEAAAYGRYVGMPSQAELAKIFFLDDDDRGLIERRRGSHMKLGFALQVVTVRYVGAFLEDPLDVPGAVVDFVAGQLEIPVAAFAPTPNGKGYWFVTTDGGIFSFGEAQFHGSMGGRGLDAPMIDIVGDRDGKGYTLFGQDGGTYTFSSSYFPSPTGPPARRSSMLPACPAAGTAPATGSPTATGTAIGSSPPTAASSPSRPPFEAPSAAPGSIDPSPAWSATATATSWSEKTAASSASRTSPSMDHSAPAPPNTSPASGPGAPGGTRR